MPISREDKMLVEKQYLIPELVNLYLNYDPNTGWLTWKNKPSHKVIIGTRAGTQVNGRDNRIIHLFGEVYIEHRLIWFMVTGKWPKGEIDHINHNEADNRWCNLREVSHEENTLNCSKRSDNTSGITGVMLDKRSNTWIASIQNKKLAVRKSRHFKTKEEAIYQRKLWEKELGFHPNHGIVKPQ